MKPLFSTRHGFSLVEVVLALGIVGFAILAIFGILPVGLNTGRSAQDETRAAQIAQDIFSSLASQAPQNFNNPAIKQTPASGPAFSYNVPLNRDHLYSPLGATSDGDLKATFETPHAYQVTITTDVDPAGFENGVACAVRVRVAWRPFTQNFREYVQIITRY